MKKVFFLIFLLSSTFSFFFFFNFLNPVYAQHVCGESCTSNSCNSPNQCINGICRNPNCSQITDCTCPTYKIQGYKVMMPGNQAKEPASSQIITVNTTSYSSNPYFATGLSGNNQVSAADMAGASIGYTLCYNSTNCHTNTPTSGNSIQILSSNVITGSNDTNDYYYADLWWHYTPLTPNCKNLKINGFNPPQTVLNGDSVSLSADYEDGDGPLTSAGMVVYNGSCSFSIFNQTQSGSPGTYTFNWTPTDTDIGTYTVFCRALNENNTPVAECRGRCVDGPPRYQCLGTDNNGATTYGNVTVKNPDPWYKLKDASLNKINNHNPLVVSNISKFAASDSDDCNTLPNCRKTIIGSSTAGILLSTGNYNPGPNYNPIPASQPNWHQANYSSFNTSLISDFYEYAKARKDIKQIYAVNDINSDGVYFIQTNGLTLSSIPSGRNFVLIVRNSNNLDYGNITINTDNFNSSNDKSVAFIANSITFDSSVQYANGIFIATNSITYQSTNGLKIKGNLISTSPISLQSLSDNSQPSLFIVFSAKMYLDLLPYLSTSTYDYQQIQ